MKTDFSSLDPKVKEKLSQSTQFFLGILQDIQEENFHVQRKREAN